MTIAVHTRPARIKEAYDSPCAEFYIDISPSERLYFSDLVQGEWEGDADFAKRVENRAAEIGAALKKFVAQHAPDDADMCINRAVSLGLLD